MGGLDRSSEPDMPNVISTDGRTTVVNDPAIINSEPVMTPHQIEEDWHGRLAVETAWLLGIFQMTPTTWPLRLQPEVVVGNTTKCQQLLVWKKQLESDANTRNSVVIPDGMDNATPLDHHPYTHHQPPSVTIVSESDVVSKPTAAHDATTSMAHSTAPIANHPHSVLRCLNEEQQRAHDIIISHLRETLAGREPPPLRMMVHGEGGTGKCSFYCHSDGPLMNSSGKSVVIDVTTDSFTMLGVESMLVKAAYMGVAASGINGKTCYVVGCLSLNSKRAISKEMVSKLRQFWKGKRYVIIDEFSMMGKTFLARLSHNISIGMADNDLRFSDHSFGGLNIIIFGDLHQFPPVAAKHGEMLYRLIDTARDDIESQIGRRIYEEFTTVVVLQQ